MYKIVRKQELAPKIKLFDIHAPRVAPKVKPGQFVILRVDERGERFPITVAGTDTSQGTVTLVFNEVGKSTRQLGALEEGDSILNVVGPLGKPSEIEKFGRVMCFGGGVMVPSLCFVASALREVGNEIVGVVGARVKDLLIFKDELKAISNEFYVTTDDGSEGNTGVDFIGEILSSQKIDRVLAMSTSEATLKAISELTRPHGIKTIVSLSPIMVDGTGMCGCCRVSVGEETKFTCVDGPEFDGHEVDWNLLFSRKRVYLPEERISAFRCEGCKEGTDEHKTA